MIAAASIIIPASRVRGGVARASSPDKSRPRWPGYAGREPMVEVMIKAIAAVCSAWVPEPTSRFTSGSGMPRYGERERTTPLDGAAMMGFVSDTGGEFFMPLPASVVSPVGWADAAQRGRARPRRQFATSDRSSPHRLAFISTGWRWCHGR